ncbi:MAG TPA: 16S rRNA (guanine(966)-N(2))-methyltransferase RsmD [Streptosporangiaceae bacterium]|nr:16S rRNA (guanine(966)-N(2))-methyltransferase RsmD [Streptosporangiaceae bacterium]
MTRVIAGVVGGRRLAVPPGLATRPTSDRAREGLFGTVQAVLGSLTGARVLDLYAGSGAVGLEALSRGAAHALLVESAPTAISAIRANIAALDLPGACLAADRVERVLARGPTGARASCGAAPGSADDGTRIRYHFVFADPPYAVGDGEVDAMLVALREGGWLADAALVTVERRTGGAPLDWPCGYRTDRVRRYGDATLWYGLAAGGSAA